MGFCKLSISNLFDHFLNVSVCHAKMNKIRGICIDFDWRSSFCSEINRSYFSGESKTQCEYCFNWVHKRSMARHIQNKHGSNISSSCTFCHKMFKNEASMKEHLRTKHSFYQTSKWINTKRSIFSLHLYLEIKSMFTYFIFNFIFRCIKTAVRDMFQIHPSIQFKKAHSKPAWWRSRKANLVSDL